MNTSFPSLQEQGKNLAKFTFNVVKDSISLTTDINNNNRIKLNVFSTSEEQKKRLDICEGCIHYYDGRCRQCGCFLKQKVKLSAAKCPMNFW